MIGRNGRNVNPSDGLWALVEHRLQSRQGQPAKHV